MKAYTAYSKDTNIRRQSSSGGIFYHIAKQVIEQGGIVFGAAWTKDWHIEIQSTDTISGIRAFMGSKYIRANLGTTFKECRDLLDLGKPVLYTGVPCQISALKSFLKVDYPNLLTISIACEGISPITMWDEYLLKLQKPGCDITNINMRSKENTSWDQYNIVVTYSDGTKLIENHNRNAYISKLYAGHHFERMCYNCIAKKNFKADIIIGDWWCVGKYIKIDTKDGVSFILTNSDKGEAVLQSLTNNIYFIPAELETIKNHNMGIQSPIPVKHFSELPVIKKRVGIITMNLHNNIGTTLQAYALQKVIKDKGFDCDIISWKRRDIHKFAYDNISLNLLNSYKDFDKIKESDYDIFVVGSDQVWNKTCLEKDYHDKALEYPFLTFTKDWSKVRFSYAASLGKGGKDWEYSDTESKTISDLLKQFNAVSVREVQTVIDFKERLAIGVTQLVDPTLLLTKEDYLKFCSDIPKKTAGVFKYILNETTQQTEQVATIAAQVEAPVIVHQPEVVEDWLACYRDAKLIVTNSYHGVLFAIIFDKPFVYYNNRNGENIRFDTLELLFNIQHRCITSESVFTHSYLSIPNLSTDTYKRAANEFISLNLAALPKLLISSSTALQKTKLKKYEDPFSWY